MGGGGGTREGTLSSESAKLSKKRHGVREIDYDTLCRVLRTRLWLGGIALAGRKS